MNQKIRNSLHFIKHNKTILYPTDTVWGIGCDATNETAVKKIYKIKKREESKAMIVLVSSLNMLKKYVTVPKKASEIIKASIIPTTIIYKNPIGLAQNLINKEDNSIAIRVVKDEFCQKLIKKFKKPIVSTSANISGERTPKSFHEIDSHILNNVDYIVNIKTEEITEKSSTILKIKKNKIVTIRK